MVKKIFPFLVVIIFAVVAGFNLLHPGFPPTHDGEYHAIRFYEFDKVLRDGNYYPRWAPDLNYGVGIPLLNYVYPLPNYIASFFHLFNISFLDSFKYSMFFAIIVGGVFFYLWSREFWGDLGGVVASIFYTFSPYHFLDVYIRGSIGEVWALALFPGFLWSITKFTMSNRTSYKYLSIILLSLMIFSHNILALMFVSFALFYVLMLMYFNKKKFNFNLLSIFLLSLAVTGIFWIPALFEKQYVMGLEVFDFKSHFPDLYQLLIPSWGSGFSGIDLQNQMSFQIGIANLISIVIAFFVLLLRKSKDKKIILFFLLSFIAVFFLMLDVSKMLWEDLPLINYFQFPWRLLSLEILISSFLIGVIFKVIKSKFRYVVSLFFIIFVFTTTYDYSKPAYYHYRNDAYYINRSNFIDSTNSPGNSFNTIWVNYNLLKRKENKLSFIEGDGKIQTIQKSSIKYIYKVDTYKDSIMKLNIAYFPGWNIKNNGKPIIIQKSDEGLIIFGLQKGINNLEIMLEETRIQSLSKLLSLFSALILVILIIRHAIIKR